MRLSIEETERPYFKDDMRPNLGIALSGGGLRASTFSYGVLKKLYDIGILQQADIISTVSGGGYTGYHIINNQIHYGKPDDPFGSATFDSSIFNQRLFEQYVRANFVTNWQIIKSFASGKSGIISMYENSIYRTYGTNLTKSTNSQNIEITSLSGPIITEQVPYWVVNTTLLDPQPEFTYDQPFEFTPVISGNHSSGYSTYQDDAETNMNKLVAISAAAEPTLLSQSILTSNEPLSQSITTRQSQIKELSDGGHSENLGALALIRRGVENIIIVDAEHDPTYQFEGYNILKERLYYFNSTLKITDIEDIINGKYGDLSGDRRGKTPIFYGQVTSPNEDDPNNPIVSNIIYIKMMNSESVDQIVKSHDAENGVLETLNIRTYLEENGTRIFWTPWKKNWHPNLLQNCYMNIDDIFSYHVQVYDDVLRENLLASLINIIPLNFTKADFPQYTTADQSFYNDQFLAFAGLGYFSASEIQKVMEKNKFQIEYSQPPKYNGFIQCWHTKKLSTM
jgi:hypothetical protein